MRCRKCHKGALKCVTEHVGVSCGQNMDLKLGADFTAIISDWISVLMFETYLMGKGTVCLRMREKLWSRRSFILRYRFL